MCFSLPLLFLGFFLLLDSAEFLLFVVGTWDTTLVLVLLGALTALHRLVVLSEKTWVDAWDRFWSEEIQELDVTRLYKELGQICL
jgi:NADH:ubiquinone oxidoreductase subunit 6 (subunit J)